MQDDNSNHTEKKQRTSRLALASIYCGLSAFVLMIIGNHFGTIYTDESVGLNEVAGIIGGILTMVSLLLSLAAVLMGIIAIVIIFFFRQKLKGYVPSLGGILFPLFAFALFMPTQGRLTPAVSRKMCTFHLEGLGRKIETFAVKNEGKLPSANNWCDVLVTEADSAASYFCCRMSRAKVGESSYALNKNVAGMKLSEIPDDVVLLFETNSGRTEFARDTPLSSRTSYEQLHFYWEQEVYLGRQEQGAQEKVFKNRWNQVGGFEILTTENHNNRGANILFADGHSEFVQTKDVTNLRWKPEE